MTIVSLIVTLQLLNISFDPADPFSGSEDLSINEIESCVELILETVLAHENAVRETDEADEAPGKPGTALTLFSSYQSTLCIDNPIININAYQPIFAIAHLESLSLPITSPPPKLL